MLLSMIHNCYNSLTDTERKIADVVLNNPQDVTRMSVHKLAERSGAASSAVIRFCQSIGVGGFSDLKLRLAEELGARPAIEELPTVQPGDGPDSVFKKVFRSGIRTLEDTLSMLNYNDIRKISEIFANANRILFCGIGTSSVIAIDAHYRFSQLGIPASSCTDILFMSVSAMNLKKGDVAVGISHSGSTKATVDALRCAKNAGASTVAITSFSDSLLAKECDYSVVAFSDEKNYPVEAVSARVAHICIIDAFMMTLATMRYDTLSEHLANRNKALGNIRY